MNELEPYHLNSFGMQLLRESFAERLQENVPLARYTSAKVGGSADALLEVNSGEDLTEACRRLWRLDLPFIILGGGANVLVSDAGVRGMVLINRARHVLFDETTTLPTVWAESGANLGAVARQATTHGLAGLEWAAGIPGTIGGAVVGNAGAHGSDIAGNLLVAEILHLDRGEEQWRVEQFEYEYRSSILKRQRGPQGKATESLSGSPQTVVLAATLKLEHGDPQQIKARLDDFTAQRRRTQPPGASMGSMFKNPPGDYAGRLIEAAGLKGARSGDAQISNMHANFFVNMGQATAQDVYKLIRLAQKTVAEKFAVQLELEVELVGYWKIEEER